MIEQKFIPEILDKFGNKKQRLEVLFDLREIKNKKWEIVSRMNYNKPNRIQKYLIETEELELSSKLSKNRFENQFFAIELNPGNYYYNNIKEIFLSKRWMQPVLKVIIYSEKNLKREKLLNINGLNEYLISGKM